MLISGWISAIGTTKIAVNVGIAGVQAVVCLSAAGKTCSRHFAEACNEWRNPLLRLSAGATQLRRNVVAVASR